MKFDGGFNFFAYAENDPVNYIDPTGEVPLLAIAAGFVIGAAIDLAFQYAEGALGECGEGFDLGRAAVAGAVGALGGGVGSAIRATARSAAKQVAKKSSVAAKDISKWLGPGTKVKTNKAGDKIFVSKDGSRKIRFDHNNPRPHNNPHGHAEELINGKWQKSGPIYYKGVPKN